MWPPLFNLHSTNILKRISGIKSFPFINAAFAGAKSNRRSPASVSSVSGVSDSPPPSSGIIIVWSWKINTQGKCFSLTILFDPTFKMLCTDTDTTFISADDLYFLWTESWPCLLSVAATPLAPSSLADLLSTKQTWWRHYFQDFILLTLFVADFYYICQDHLDHG